MTDTDAKQRARVEQNRELLGTLGEAIELFVNRALDRVTEKARLDFAKVLQNPDARLVVVVDVVPMYSARLVVHRPGVAPVTVCELKGNGPDLAQAMN